MPSDASFDAFENELNRVVESSGKRIAERKKSSYVEAQLRDDFLNPLFRAPGWDKENRAGLIQCAGQMAGKIQIGLKPDSIHNGAH